MKNREKYIKQLLENIPDLSSNVNLNNLIKTKEEIIKENALNKAWEVRNFEIELYWKRALYFWGFIALAFSGLITILNIKNDLFDTSWINHNLIAFIFCITGIVFSYAWYLVNRASKRWQENWEQWIVYLEESLYGKLYQTPIDFEEIDKNVERKEDKYISLCNCGKYSVSRINIFISLFITLIWIGLSFVFIFEEYKFIGIPINIIVILGVYFFFEGFTKSNN